MLILTYNHIICFLVPFRICFLFPKNLSDNFIFYTLENAFLMLVSTFRFSPISLSCLYRYHPKKYKITFFIPASSRKKVLLKGLGITSTSPLYNKISIHSWCIKTSETNQGMEQVWNRLYRIVHRQLSWSIIVICLQQLCENYSQGQCCVIKGVLIYIYKYK